MKLHVLISKFRRSESGAVTVDWVVLTAAVVALGIVVAGEMKTAASSMVSRISSSLSAVNIGTTT